MSRNQRMLMDGKDVARFLTSTVCSFVQDRLIDRYQRLIHKDECAERLAAHDGGGATDVASSLTSDGGGGGESTAAATSAVRYSDQAVLANLDWGIDALEEAISTSNVETKLARLDHAEKMLQVCAMLDPALTTAGIPNSYLSAWAHLYLSFLWAVRTTTSSDSDSSSARRCSVLHVLEMFTVDPFFSRIDFAPELWEPLFLPHMGSIVGWYSEARHRVVMEAIPDSADLSFTVGDSYSSDRLFHESLVLSLRPDQAEKLRELERIYGDSLDHHTRLYAKHYRDCVSHDPATASVAGSGKKGVVPMLPIAEPPMTPLHEVSRSIPDYVKFGPILPKSAGFPSVPKVKEKEKEEEKDGGSAYNTRMDVTSNSAQELGDSVTWDFQEALLEENEDEIDSDGGDVDIDSKISALKLVAVNSTRPKEDEGGGSRTQLSRKKHQSSSLKVFSPVDSPKASPPTVSSPKPVAPSKKAPEQFIRLSSRRIINHSPKAFSPLDSPGTLSKVSSPKPMKDSKLLHCIFTGHSTSLSVLPHPCNDLSTSSEDSDEEVEIQKGSGNNCTGIQSLTYSNARTNLTENSFYTESEEEVNQSNISLPSSEKTPQSRPPKDFVCPITGQLFSDPVTLETGQTYERRAIQEWLRRGNSTCPITRQPLSATVLPKTNYVLKRLITSWKEQHPDLAQEFSYSEPPSASFSPISTKGVPLKSTTSPAYDTAIKGEMSKRFMRPAVSTSPTSVICQAAIETVINGLKPYTSCLCTSEDLQECEAAVLNIARIWKDSKANPGIHPYLSKPTIVNGFMEILSVSISSEVLRTSIYILSELISMDESVGETLMSVDSDFDCLAALLRNGLAEAAVLIYLLRPAFSQLSNHDLISPLVQVIVSKGAELDDFHFVMDPKDAAIAILEQILLGGDENSRSFNTLNVISSNGLPALIKCLNRAEGRLAVVSILLSCMHEDRNCRNLIANRAELAPVLELFYAGNESTRSICIDFISEFVCLNRRTVCNQILQIIKDEGAFSTMHTFLVYLQMAPMEQQPVVASLLLQLDLLVEPQKMSIYREEAIDALIEALYRKDFPVCQTIALNALSSLSGRLSASGKPLTEAWLLKTAGFVNPYSTLMKEESMKLVEDVSAEKMEEEEKATSAWEKRVSYVLCNHDNGSIFKALEECLRSNSLEMAKSCLVISTWLTHMLNNLPDTGIRVIARHRLLDQFINVLQSSRNLEDKVLASLALKTFISDQDALKELGMYAKSIFNPLRKLKRCSVVVTDTMKALMNLPSVDTTGVWSCTEVNDIDSSANGEVLSLVYLQGRVFSSHSDGFIKVWDAGKRGLRLIQEVREHKKAVTCLFVPLSGDKLYSGSLDKTIRVWAIEPEEIHCLQVHDMKEAVHFLAANTNLACFASQGTGVKVYNWHGFPKHINFNRNVKCLAMMEEHLYCGCTGCTIQEVDLSKCTSSTLFSGTRKLLGKQTIHALCIHNGVLFAGGSSVDGTAGKVFLLSAKSATGSFSTGFDIHSIAANNEFVFTGTKCGMIEVWLRERLARVASVKVSGGTNTKVTSLASDSDGEMLFAGSSDGRIQVWALD